MARPFFNRKSITILEPSIFMGIINKAAAYNFRFAWKDTVIITEQSDTILRLMTNDELRVVELKYVRLYNQVIFFIQNGWFVIELSFLRAKDRCSAHILLANTKGHFFEIEETVEDHLVKDHLFVSNNFLNRLNNPQSSRIPKQKEKIMAIEDTGKSSIISEGILEHIDKSVVQQVDIASVVRPTVDVETKNDDTQSFLVLDSSMQIFDENLSWTFMWEPSTRPDKFIATSSGNLVSLLSDFRQHKDRYLKMEALLLNLLDKKFDIKQLSISRSKNDSVVILKYKTPDHRAREQRYFVDQSDFSLIPDDFIYDLEMLPSRQG